MKKVLAIVLAVMTTVALMATPALAKGPKYDKYEAPLSDGSDSYGKVIYNTNQEDDDTYELEVEVEECEALAESTVDVYLDSVMIGSIYIDEYGNGKVTFYVDGINAGSLVEVGALTSGAFTLWSK